MLSLFTTVKCLREHETFRNKDFIFILKVAILSFKSLRFILLFRVCSLLEALFKELSSITVVLIKCHRLVRFEWSFLNTEQTKLFGIQMAN